MSSCVVSGRFSDCFAHFNYTLITLHYTDLYPSGLAPLGDEYDFCSSYAVRDIKAGEQLLDDYGLFVSGDLSSALV